MEFSRVACSISIAFQGNVLVYFDVLDDDGT